MLQQPSWGFGDKEHAHAQDHGNDENQAQRDDIAVLSDDFLGEIIDDSADERANRGPTHKDRNHNSTEVGGGAFLHIKRINQRLSATSRRTNHTPEYTVGKRSARCHFPAR